MNYFTMLAILFLTPQASAQTYPVNQEMGRVEAGVLRYKIEANGESIADWQEQKSPQILYLDAGTRVSLAIDLQVTQPGPIYLEYYSL